MWGILDWKIYSADAGWRDLPAAEKWIAGIRQHHQHANGDESFSDLDSARLPFTKIRDKLGERVAAQTENICQTGKYRNDIASADNAHTDFSGNARAFAFP